MLPEDISFDHELSRGVVTYNERVGHWWHRQAVNHSHRYAYRNIANFIRASIPGAPEHIVDYACGGGNLLARLHGLFPESRLTGLDGSNLLLQKAQRRLARHDRDFSRRVTLVETALPNFDLPGNSADLVVFAFPNLVPTLGRDDTRDNERLLGRTDTAVGRALAEQIGREDGCEDEIDEIYSTLLRDRLASKNMRHLLKASGYCVRVEYANVRRDDLPPAEVLLTGYEEGSFDLEIGGKQAMQWFRVAASAYFRSGVMEDVYHQSEDESDREGGYFITILKCSE
jgi:SAM-dependent methyltransferase